MTRGKRQKARDKRGAAAKQKQSSKQPSPTVATIETFASQPAPAVPAHPTETGNQKAGDQNKREGPASAQTPVDWQRLFYKLERRQDFYSACLVVLAIVAAIIGYGQWDATRKQYDAMERQLVLLEVDQRPWIGITASLKRLADEEKVVEYRFRNYGKVPAFIKQVRISGFYGKSPFETESLLKEHNSDESIAMGNVVFPDQTVTAEKKIAAEQQEIFKDLKAKEAVFFLLTTITYSDIPDGKERTTRACWSYDPEKDGLIEHSEHNHAD